MNATTHPRTDAQVHIWPPNTQDRPWPADGPARAHGYSFTAEALLLRMNDAAVERAVLVPPTFAGSQNDFCLAAARRYPDRFAVMGNVDLQEPSKKAVEAIATETGLLGFRLVFYHGAARTWLDNGTADWFWPVADELRLPLMIFAPGRAPDLYRLAKTYTRIRFIIDHFNIPTTSKDNAVIPAIDDLLQLALLPNVAVKASSLPSYVTEPYPYPQLNKQIARVVQTFGSKRVFWGSDLSRLRCSYSAAIKHFTEGLEFLSGDDLDWIMSRGISSWLGWAYDGRDQML
jgi:L-fuconolactonase